MDLENMKSEWSKLNTRVDNIETNLINQKFDNMKTAQQKLINQYRAIACIAAAFISISLVVFSRLTANIWLELGSAIFFAVCAVMDFILQHKVGEIDFGTMTVTEVAQRAASCRRLHHIFQLFLIPMAVGLISLMIYEFSSNTAFTSGLCIGGAIGLVIGLRQYFKFMDNYKTLIR